MKLLTKVLLAFAVIFIFGCKKSPYSSTDVFSSPLYNTGYGFPEMPQSEKYKDYEENPFLKAAEFPLSTFSVDADGGSYSNMRRFAHLGQLAPKASVRIEEYINYFTYDYTEPSAGESVAINAEVSTCPWNTEHHLLRIGMKGKTIPENSLPPSNYVFLIDVSGSMSTPDKLELLKSGFKTMTDNLLASDKVAIVTYAGNVGVLLDATSGSEKQKIKAAIDKLGSGGSTAGAAGITTAYQIAEKNFVRNGNNRIILGTDGDFNVGISSTDELIKLIESKRDKGIYLTVLGVGGGNLNDHMMEQIANKGNGNYEYIDNAKQILKVFVYERSKFYTVAKDSKIQMKFNPDRVDSYRLIGYENRALDNKDFEEDSTDAGEIGSGQTITALYEVILKAGSSEKLATFDFKYKLPGNEVSRPLTLDISGQPVAINAASENMRFVSAVTGLGLVLKQSQYKGTLNKQMILNLGKTATTFDPNGYRKGFLEIVQNLNF